MLQLLFQLWCVSRKAANELGAFQPTANETVLLKLLQARSCPFGPDLSLRFNFRISPFPIRCISKHSKNFQMINRGDERLKELQNILRKRFQALTILPGAPSNVSRHFEAEHRCSIGPGPRRSSLTSEFRSVNLNNFIGDDLFDDSPGDALSAHSFSLAATREFGRNSVDESVGLYYCIDTSTVHRRRFFTSGHARANSYFDQ